MKKSIQECREALAKNTIELRELVEANPGNKWQDKHQAKFVELNKEIEAANAGINEIEGFHQTLSGEGNGSLDPNNCAGIWRDKTGNPVAVLGPEHSLAGSAGGAGSYAGDVSAGSIMRALALGPQNAQEIKALSEGTDSAGGYSVPDLISRQVIDLARAKSHVIKAGALTVPLDTEKTSIVRVASDPVPAWRLENASVAESEPTFEAVTFTARSLAVLVKASRELMEDSINMGAALQMVLAGAIANEVDRVSLLGSGSAPEPTGIVNATGVNTLDLGTNGMAIDDYGYVPLLSAYQLMADGNAEDPTAVIMAPRERFTYAKMMDGNGQPLQRPDILKDLPFYRTTKIPVDGTHGTATDASNMFLGDFSKLMFGIRSNMRIEVLKQTFAENLQIGFLCHLRMDIALAQPKAFTVIKGVVPAP